jgi:hypothetical protein
LRVTFEMFATSMFILLAALSPAPFSQFWERGRG